ncbi:MAG: S1 RNA-binding domain-containing protein [Lachnospiraceae bacterium]
MIRLGEKQELVVAKRVEFGVYLAQDMESAGEERVLLPIRQVPDGTEVGDKLEVFIYKDSRDRMIATTREPKITLHQVARLTVAQTAKIGAFLDWGLEKDLLLPFREQTARVREGQEVLAALYIDKSSRLCATMNVYEYLSTDSPYHKDDRVEGTVYEISQEFGAFVAVDDKYSGLIPRKEFYGNVRIGDRVSARVTSVKEDGKLDLSLREKAYLQIAGDAERVMAVIDSFDGALPFNDKANPDVIRREMQMSKNEFKRAVGNLLKNGRIIITETGILRKES